MTEALARAKPQIDDPEELDRVVHRLVEAFDPAAVYLFGSRARGDAGADSDYDLLLMLADDNTRVRSRQAVWEAALRSYRRQPFSLAGRKLCLATARGRYA